MGSRPSGQDHCLAKIAQFRPLIALKLEVVDFSGAVILTTTLRARSFCFRMPSSCWESFTFRVHLKSPH